MSAKVASSNAEEGPDIQPYKLSSEVGPAAHAVCDAIGDLMAFGAFSALTGGFGHCFI